MAQSALTVTPPSPTPPTNMSCTGATPPNPPNLTKNTYADYADNTKFDTAAPPYFDDGSAGALTTMAANTAALASGSGDTAGGTGNPTGSTAGTPGTYPGVANGTVPASTSVAHEGAGTEVVVTSPGSRAECPTQQVSVLGNRTTSPNQDHASTLSPAGLPTLASISPTTTTAGSGTVTITCTGTNYTKQSVVYASGVAQPTTFVSATSITAAVTKRGTAGTQTINVVTGGVVQNIAAENRTLTYT